MLFTGAAALGAFLGALYRWYVHGDVTGGATYGMLIRRRRAVFLIVDALVGGG